MFDCAITGKAVTPTGIIDNAVVVVDHGVIVYVGESSSAPEGADEARARIRHDGYILPGLIDIHNHGGGGFSFPDTVHPDDAMVAVLEHRRHGTTDIVASLVSAAHETLIARVEALATLCERDELAGIHIEGPFISPARKGAHDPQFITEGQAWKVRELLHAGRGHVVSMTVAPEADPTFEVARALIDGGALPSYGHTDCSGADMSDAIASARKYLMSVGEKARSARPTSTHLYNAMRPIHHRDAGPALAAIDAASRGEIINELIADGVHTAADTVAYTFQITPADHLMLITDAMAAAGMPDGSYVLGSLPVTVKNSVATLSDGGAIAGGTAHLLDVVRFVHIEAGVDLSRAVYAASVVPANVLGIRDRAGALEAGVGANLVLTSTDLRCDRVMRRGTWLE